MIVARVRRTIRERALFEHGARVLVACSGGPDSAALLHVLDRLAPPLGLSLAAASVDHGLRVDAARDVEVARALAAGLGIPFTPLRVTVAPAGPSVQAKARRARYGALLAEARRVGASALAVGHTLDDQAETVLGRVLRGSGVSGLAGIEPRREDGVVRPLIDCRREDVLAYAARHALPVTRDPSNDDARYERVRLRTDVLPVLTAEDPRAVQHLAQLADDARALRDWVRAAADALLVAAKVEGGLDADLLLAAPAPVRVEALSVWARTLTGAPTGRAHIASLEQTLKNRGESLLPKGWLVRLSRRVLTARCDPDAPTRSRRGKDPE